MRFHYSKKMLRRILRDPGMPPTNPTRSVWQDPPHELSTAKSSVVPTTADVVILGSGITSCAVASTLLSTSDAFDEKPSVVILEARTLVSGASGRNGGHLRDTPFMYMSYLKERFGEHAARKMSLFRARHVTDIVSLAEKEGLFATAEFKQVEAVDIALDGEKWAELKLGADDYLKSVPEEERREFKIWDSDDARKQFHVPKAVGAFTSQAWTHSTYQLVAGLFQKLQATYNSRLSLEAETPAISISPLGDCSEPYRYAVETHRGIIKCRHVIHCTNSHAAHLLPGLRGKVIPVRDQMTEQSYDIPGPEDNQLRSWIFFWDKGVDYMIHRSGTKGRAPAMLLGGGLSHAGDDGLDEIGNPEDNDQTITIPAYLSGLLPNVFSRGLNSNVVSVWTGVLGWSADLLPWVGQVPASVSKRPTHLPAPHEFARSRDLGWENVPGQEWISAGYSGEGMTLAWGCGKAIAYMVLGIDRQMKVAEWLPEEYIITDKRVEEADVRKLKEFY